MMNKKISYSFIEYFALFSCAIIILWQYLPLDGAGRFPLLLMTISTILFVKDLFERQNLAILLYFILTTYVYVNALFKGSTANYDDNGAYLIFVNIFKAPMVMLSMAVLFRKNFDKTLKYVAYIFLMFTLCALIFGSRSSAFDGRYTGGAVAINELALYMTCCIDCLILLCVRRQITLLKAICLALVPFALLIQTASRTGLVMLVIFVLGVIAISFDKRKIAKSIAPLVALIVFLFAMTFIMENTQMGERLSATTSQSEGMSFETGTVLDYIGDRGAQYYFSWPYFLKNKWTGIGFGIWRKFNPTGHIVHSDYLYAYLENGIIGFCLYLSFVVSLFKMISRGKFYQLSQVQKSNIFEYVKSRVKGLAEGKNWGLKQKNIMNCSETNRNLIIRFNYRQYMRNSVQNKTRILLIVFLISVLAGAFATRIYSQPGIFIFYSMMLALPYSERYSKV